MNFTNSPLIREYIGKRKLLSKDEEEELFKKYKETQDPILLEQITYQYSPLVISAISKVSGYKIDPDELFSEGMVALIEAANRFDSSRNFRFSTLAKNWIKGILFAYISKNYFIVNVCSSAERKKMFFSLRKMIVAMMAKNEKFEIDGEMIDKIAEIYHVDAKEVEEMNQIIMNPYDSISAKKSNGGSGNEEPNNALEDILVSQGPSIEDTITENNTVEFYKRIVNKAIETTLTTREKRIFIAQCLSDDDNTMTLDDLGKEFNITRERVRQIRNKAEFKVHRAIKNAVENDNINIKGMF